MDTHTHSNNQEAQHLAASKESTPTHTAQIFHVHTTLHDTLPSFCLLRVSLLYCITTTRVDYLILKEEAIGNINININKNSKMSSARRSNSSSRGSGSGSSSRHRSSSSSNHHHHQNTAGGAASADDEYARQLQDQYRQEFVARQRERSRGAATTAAANASAPPESVLWGGSTSGTRTSNTPFVPPTTMVQPTDHDQYEVHLDHDDFDNDDADARYARQLQLEMEREEERLRQASSSSRRQSRSSSSSYEITPVWNTEPPHRDADEDARLAQQLQDEELARQLSSRFVVPGRSVPRTSNISRSGTRRSTTSTSTSSNNNSNNKNDPFRNSSSTPYVVPPQPSSDPFIMNPSDQMLYCHDNDIPPYTRTNSTVDTNSDTSAQARRIAQEMDDAEMAQRLALYEQEAQTRRESERSGRTSRLLVGRILPLLCCGLAVAISLLFVLGVFDPNNVPVIGDWLDERGNANGGGWLDPFKGNSTDGQVPTVDRSEQMGWSNDGRSGLQLEIVNALEDKWQTLFATAVQNWDEGYPIDSLTLTVSRASYEVECSPITGKMKVCNADYGATRWRGLNEVLLNRQSNVIVSSSAKMNEYYLKNEDSDQQLYTLCHEIGHGFGLPHWDEDFFNKDLGNCMDYTNNPGANKEPDATNFMFLAQIYGGVNVSTGELVSQNMLYNDGSATTGDTTGTDTTSQKKDKNNDTKQPGGRRLGQQYTANTQEEEEEEQISPIPRGLSYWANLPLNEDDSSSAVISSQVRLLPDMNHQRRRRRVLQANDHFEVHRLEQEIMDDIVVESGDGDLVTLQFYLLAE